MKNRKNSLDSLMVFWERTSRLHVPFWIILHGVILTAAFLLKPISVNADLYSILPATNDSRGVSDAEKKLSASTNSRMFILVSHKDFATAKNNAALLAAKIGGHPDIEKLSFTIDAAMYSSIREFLYQYRYQIQADATLNALRNGEARNLADEALSAVYAPFSFSSIGNLAEDPFLLTESSVRSYLEAALKNGMSVMPKEGVLASEKDGINYVLVGITSRSGGTSLDTKSSLVSEIYNAESVIRDSVEGVGFSNSGVPFHSYESSSRAQREITIISIASMILSVLILLLVYRSAVPLVSTVFAIAMGALTAFAVTLLAFGEVHVFTLAFGTSLIGVSVDYALHFFTESRVHKTPRDGSAILRNVLNGVWLGLITTLISYAVLLAAPFPLLRQMAVFSITGLISMFSTVILLFPKVSSSFGESRPLPLRIGAPFLRGATFLSSLKRRQRYILVCCLALAAFPGLRLLKFDNDIRGLYAMSPTLMESERTVANVLDYGSSGWYFIISGNDAESLLQNEEKLASKLLPNVGTDRLGSFICTSRFLPSQSRQIETVRLIRENLVPLAPSQLTQLGFSDEDTVRFTESFSRDSRKILLPEEYFRQPIGDMTKTFWIGDVDGKFYSAVLPLHAKDPAFFRNIASSMEGVSFINKTADISSTLRDISLSRILLLAFSYCAMIAFLSFRYGLALSLKISRGPVAACILTCAILGYAGFPLNLFSVMGLVLIIGIGIDYSIFLTEAGQKKDSAMLAVVLCMLTTIFSFGTLSLSSLKPVSTFGFTLFVGILLSFLIAPVNTARIHEHLARAKEKNAK